jgi:4,5-DOPA dioxygenase extradiol
MAGAATDESSAHLRKVDIMANSSTAPVLFISHGAPTFALEPGALGARLREVGADLKDIRAILVVSPHWQTRNLEVMTTEKPATVHDFSGFPSALYSLVYPAHGAPEAAREVASRLREGGWQVAEDAGRGLDHGAWVPLMHLLPGAEVPVFQLSLPDTLGARQLLELGRVLAALRRQGIAIVASGSMTHNLHEFRGGAARPEAYVTEFARWVRAAVERRDLESLVNYRRLAPHAERAHPTEEHFLPLLVAVGATLDDEPLDVLDGEVIYGMLSMESYAWGLPSRVSARGAATSRAEARQDPRSPAGRS